MRGILALTVALIVLGYGWVALTVIKLNEPDPETVDVSVVETIIERSLTDDNVVGVKIHKLLYVNKDFMAYIFFGSLGNLAPDDRDWANHHDYKELTDGAFERLFEGRSGTVRRKRAGGGRLLVGVVISTDRSPISFQSRNIESPFPCLLSSSS